MIKERRQSTWVQSGTQYGESLGLKETFSKKGQESTPRKEAISDKQPDGVKKTLDVEDCCLREGRPRWLLNRGETKRGLSLRCRSPTRRLIRVKL